MNQAIFRSTSQALHFAYLIEAYEVSVESIMSKAMRIIMMELGLWNTGEPSTVNFGGLNALEVRAQCAMIRAAVRSRLPAPEAWAIQARYGINEIILEDGQRKPVFSRERYDAIMRLGDWLAPAFSNFNPLAVDLLVARACDKRVVDVTFRQMSENFGLDHSTYAYALKRVRGKLEDLEKMAINRLEPAFMADGLVEPDMNFVGGA